MKRFRFNLEKVLELRQYREQEAKNELGKAISILTAIENDIQTNAMVRARAVQERFSGIESGDDDGAFSMMTWDSYINRLEQEAQRLMEEAARAELVVEEKRAAYLDASREVKVMEKLKEKRAGEYRKEMFATETRELDDMYRPRR
jgi:flagellar FliJ protein